jgi:hypothetical protein
VTAFAPDATSDAVNVGSLARSLGVRPLTQAATAARTGALPVADGLAEVLPDGLRRGATVEISGSSGVMSLVLALLGRPSTQGLWSAAVGFPLLSGEAAADYGIDLARFALVPRPGPDWTTVVGALLDSIDVVAVQLPRPPARLADADARRLAARARQRGSVLIPVPGQSVDRRAGGRTDSGGGWPTADVRLRVDVLDPQSWDGLGAGHGRLQRRRVALRASGRGAAARPRSANVWLPDALGAVSADQRPGLISRSGAAVTSLTRFAAHRAAVR